MRINRALNLVIKVETESAGMVFVHSTPISREMFETYFLVMSKTFAEIYTQGLTTVAGPRVAYLMLRDISERLGRWEDVKTGLVNEIVRLTNVAVKTERGYEHFPLNSAYERGLIDAEARSDIEGEIVFFILTSAMNKREQIPQMMEAVNGLWQSQTTALTFTEYLSSLTISTKTENTGATANTSSASDSVTSPEMDSPNSLANIR